MVQVLVAGAGNVGTAVARLLRSTGDYEVTMVDRAPERLSGTPDGARSRVLDVGDPSALTLALAGCDVLVNTCPFHPTVAIAKTALACGVHYFDLTEDVATARAVRQMAAHADTVLVSQCGLAPGFISIVGSNLARKFERLDTLKLRVGALPLYPSNMLKYNLTWSTDGLINEYCNLCEAIIDGEPCEVAPLEGLEEFSLDGTAYEAFNTSGGLGTLCEMLAGKVQNLTYKAVRYPGHNAQIRLLAFDLKLCQHRDLFKQLLELAVPMTVQDVVVVFATATGNQGGRFTQETFAKRIYGREIGGVAWSAIQLTTAAAVCTMVDLHREGKLPPRGVVRQEDVHLSDFLANRFGQLYA